MNYLGYPVTFGYLEKTKLSTGELYTHRGIDLGSFDGQELCILGVLIGLTGSTGKTQGSHTHVQAGLDPDAQQTIDPAPFIGKPGVVVKVGEASQWGKFVCIKVGDVYVYYCHLSRIDVKVGQVIGGEQMIENNDGHYQFANLMHRHVRGRELSRKDFEGWVGRTWLSYIETLAYDKEADKVFAWQTVGKTAVEDNWRQQILDRDARIKELETLAGAQPQVLKPGIYKVS